MNRLMPLFLAILLGMFLALFSSCRKDGAEEDARRNPKRTATELAQSNISKTSTEVNGKNAIKIEPIQRVLDQEELEISRGRRIWDEVTQLAKTDMSSAIRRCNAIVSSIDAELFPTNSVEHILASAFQNAKFGKNFTSLDKATLGSIIDSELNAGIKDRLLIDCSANYAGRDDVANLLDFTLHETQAGPNVITSMYQHLAALDPAYAFKHLRAQAWKPEFAICASAVSAAFIKRDPEAASIAANDIPRNTLTYQWAAAGIVQAIRTSDPEAAAAWRHTISDIEAAGYADRSPPDGIK